MFAPLVLGVALALSAANASPLDKKALVDDCLTAANVPVDTPGSDDWASDAAPFNVRIPFKPIAIAVPTSTEEIQAAVKCGVQAGVKVTAKCGGHSYANFGFGGEDGHLMLELDRMYNVTVDNATGIATIQGGSRLGHVANELFKQGGKAISHGTCPGVGVGGHVLHGGYGMSSHTYGLCLDWLVGAKVVLANSTVVTVSDDENPELYWALKGAGSSMGIVSEFYFKTYDAPKNVTTFMVMLQWTADKAVAGFKAIQEYAENEMPKELNMRVFITPRFTNLEGLYYGDKASLQAVLDPLLKTLGGKLTQAQTTDWLGQLQHFGNGLSLDQTHPYKKQENFHSSSLYSDKLTDEQIQGFVGYWYGVGRSLKRDWYVQVDLHGGKYSAIPQATSESAAYSHRNKLLLYQFYDRVDVNQIFPKDGFSFVDGFVANATATMKPAEYGMYFNYPDPNLKQDEAQSLYWGASLPRLQEVKAAVDPAEVFYLPQSVRPAKPVAACART